MDSWERFNKTKLPTKEKFHSNLNMENITDDDYKDKKMFGKVLVLGDYHAFYVQTDTLLLANVFQNFRKKMCGNI